MSNVLMFNSVNSNNPRRNIQEFVAFSKFNFIDFNLINSWGSNVWKRAYRFNKFNVNNNLNSKEALDDSFIDFAKAYMLHIHSFNKAKLNPIALSMLKIVEFVLIKLRRKADVIQCDNFIFDECIRLATAKYSKLYAVGVGKELEKLSVFLSDHKMVTLSYFSWVNPLRYKITQSWKGYEPSLEGHSKLPDVKSVIAIAEIFSKDESQLSTRDIFTTSVLALLMCAPGRISEILGLPADCEITEYDSKGIERYGLRFFSAKGYEGDIKWVPTKMVPVAKKAINRLRGLSNHARSIAKKIEDNLAESSKEQLCKKVPKEFPWYDKEKKIKYSNALCLLSEGQLCDKNKREGMGFFKATAQLFIADLTDSVYIKGKINIFKRHCYFNDDGSPYLLRTHQLRHLINTFSQINGLDEFSIARWSGRKLISQNLSYDHRSHIQMTQIIREKKTQEVNNHCGKEIPIMVLNDFESISSGAILVTKYGYCKHSYAFEPCSSYPIEESGMDEDTMSMLHSKIIEKTLYDKNDGNINAEKWYEFQNKLKGK